MLTVSPSVSPLGSHVVHINRRLLFGSGARGQLDAVPPEQTSHARDRYPRHSMRSSQRRLAMLVIGTVVAHSSSSWETFLFLDLLAYSVRR